MNEYIEQVLLQIRCKKARPYIEEELKSHIEDQAEDNIRSGMSREEAYAAAVKDMGDPVAAGIELDRIHKPKMSWEILAIVSVISILGIILHRVIVYKEFNSGGNIYGRVNYGSNSYIFKVLAGLTLMFIIYFIDYTVIAKYAKIIGILIFVLMADTFISRQTVGGMYYYISLPGRIGCSSEFILIPLMMFFVPVYGGILYKYRGGSVKDLQKCIIWLIMPVAAIIYMSDAVVSVVVFICLLAQLTMVLYKGWFNVNSKRVIACLWSMFIFIFVSVILLSVFLPVNGQSYRAYRIKAFFNFDPYSLNAYVPNMLRSLSRNLMLAGNSGHDVMNGLPSFSSDYILIYILNSYGVIAGIIAVAAVSFFIITIFRIVFKQKNELGCVMGFGCGMLFLINMIINIFECTGHIPLAASFFPFLSANGGKLVMTYALTGIILSIYKYKDVYPKHVMINYDKKIV